MRYFVSAMEQMPETLDVLEPGDRIIIPDETLFGPVCDAVNETGLLLTYHDYLNELLQQGRLELEDYVRANAQAIMVLTYAEAEAQAWANEQAWDPDNWDHRPGDQSVGAPRHPQSTHPHRYGRGGHYLGR